ncbi:MAG: hypothetical protein ACREII_03965 [Nitrospiraceae bacterium]
MNKQIFYFSSCLGSRMICSLAIAAVLLAGEPPDSQSYVNQNLSHLLNGQTLKVEEAKVGMKISLHSLLVTAPLFEQPKGSPQQSTMTISFKRSDVHSHYLALLFSRINATVRSVHPFADRGIESVLTDNSLTITLHSGVMLHLRNDIQALPQTKVFVSEDAVGAVTEVHGRAFVSTDRIVKEKLVNIWTYYPSATVPCILGYNCFEQSDGRYIMTGDVMPQYFPPRKEGPQLP